MLIRTMTQRLIVALALCFGRSVTEARCCSPKRCRHRFESRRLLLLLLLLLPLLLLLLLHLCAFLGQHLRLSLLRHQLRHLRHL
jgi:hypothetical protein|eukprot:COSAG06_NODE_5700_length_3313_cov_3.423460_2_plen_84_part_00